MGAAIHGDGQKHSFQQRLVRIHDGGEFTTRRLYVGPVSETGGKTASRKARREAAALQDNRRRSLLGEMLMLPAALALGAVAVVAARAVAFHLLSGQSLYAAHAWYADLALAAVLALILRSALKMSGGIRGKAFFAGFVAMVLFQGLFVVRAPGAFSLIYSHAYVAETQALVGRV